MGKRAGHQIYVEIPMVASLDRLWELSQDPVLHPRWDLRFTSIKHLGSGPVYPQTIGARPAAQPDWAQQFRYEFRLPLHTIHGTGTSLGSRRSADGSATSVLKFTTTDVLSPIESGAGYWRYLPFDGGIRFLTGYNYQPGWGAAGKILDSRLIRPALGWATAISFDRLRLWAEHDVDPGTARNAWLADAAVRVTGTFLAVVLLETARRRVIGDGVSLSSMCAATLGAALIAGARWYPAPDLVPRASRCSRTAQNGTARNGTIQGRTTRNRRAQDPASRRAPAASATLAEPV